MSLLWKCECAKFFLYSYTYKAFSCLWYSIISCVYYPIRNVIAKRFRPFLKKCHWLFIGFECKPIHIFKNKRFGINLFNSSEIFRNRESSFFIFKTSFHVCKVVSGLTIWRTGGTSNNNICLTFVFCKIYLSNISAKHIVCSIILFQSIACNIPYIRCKNCMESCFFESQIQTSTARE